MRRCVSIGLMGLLIVMCYAAETRAESEIDAIHDRIYQWRDAWVNRDFAAYMHFYHPAFRSGKHDYNEWGDKKKELFDESGAFSVDIFGLSVFMQGDHAVARFIQRFLSASLADVGEKTLVLEKLDQVWKIISEEWQTLQPGIALPIMQPESSKQAKTVKAVPVIKHEIGEEGLFYRVDDDGSEKVYIRLKKFFIPKIFNLEGEKPRIVIDIPNVSQWDHKTKIPAGGRRIRQVRSHHHSQEGRLRVVLDLVPAENYIVDQQYDRSDNVYCVEVK